MSLCILSVNFMIFILNSVLIFTALIFCAITTVWATIVQFKTRKRLKIYMVFVSIKITFWDKLTKRLEASTEHKRGSFNDCLSNTNSIYCDNVASVRLWLIHFIVYSHLVRLIVHLLAGDLIVDVLRPQTVVVA